MTDATARYVYPGEPPLHEHLWPDTARVSPEGRLSIGGLDVAALAREYGTPLYVYDEETLRGRMRAFRSAFAARWPESAVAYAGKAYLSLALCRLLWEEGLELDAVSAGELGLAQRAGFPAERIHLHGNMKPDNELDGALEAGVGRIVVDSLDELARVAALGEARQRRIAIWLRINPDIATETHVSIQTGHAGSKFGLTITGGAALEAARRAAASPWLNLAGLHAHAGSQLFDATPATRVIETLATLAATIHEQTGSTIRELSPGGGLGVAYLPDERALAPEVYAGAVCGALRTASERLRLEPMRLTVEPGRAIVARAGVALYTVGPRKARPNAITLAVDGGMGDNPRPALYGARYHAALPERMNAPATESVQVVGRYCESGDVLVQSASLPQAKPGEILAVPVSGAYHLAMASAYNLVPRPAVVFLRDGRARLVRRRETLDDLIRLELT
ncbi:MAG TPA: diaminopimelate decarboxylase [Ktedonobacterales bacterium]